MKTSDFDPIPGTTSTGKNESHWREIIIRIAGIVTVSAITLLVAPGYSEENQSFIKEFLISLIRTALIWNGSMFIIQFAINRFSILKETAVLIAVQVIGLTAFVIVVEILEFWAIRKFLHITLTPSERALGLTISLLVTFMISSIYASVAFFIHWKANFLRSQALEKANLEAQYDTLRNQVNPHFLFNSLNTLLMLVNENPVASRYVESISEIMRYMLQSSDKSAVLLREELKIARDYDFVQQSRFGEKLKIEFDVPERFYHFAIPPLALQMLLENAIKHNIVSKDDPLHIKVYIHDNHFIVVENPVKAKIDKDPSTGVGLDNIRKRYIHLTGRDIVVNTENNTFTVMLPLFERPI